MKRLFSAFLLASLLCAAQVSNAQQYNVWILEPGLSFSLIVVNVVNTNTWFNDNLVNGGNGYLGPWPWCCWDSWTVHRMTHDSYMKATTSLPVSEQVDWQGFMAIARVGGADIGGVDENGNVAVSGPNGQSVSIPAESLVGSSPQDLSNIAQEIASQESLVNGSDSTSAGPGESVSVSSSESQNSTGAEYE